MNLFWKIAMARRGRSVGPTAFAREGRHGVRQVPTTFACAKPAVASPLRRLSTHPFIVMAMYGLCAFAIVNNVHVPSEGTLLASGY